MLSQQRNASAQAPNAVNDEEILDAAYGLLLGIGIRRLTMADIARRAGVSRATLYRRWQNVGQVVAALMTREWSAMATKAVAAAHVTSTARERLVDVVVTLARDSREHPLLRKIVDVDPDFLVPYLLHRRGTNTDNQLGLLERGLSEGFADGSIRAGDITPLAQSVLLTAWSFVLTGPVLTDDHDALDTQLRELLDRYLAP